MLYYASSFVDKSVVTAKDLPVYSNTSTSTSVGSIPKGTALTVYSYLIHNVNLNRPYSWFMFMPSSGKPYYIPIIEGYFDKSFFEDSGILTASQTDKQLQQKLSVFGLDEKGNQLTTDDYIKKYLPFVALLFVGGVSFRYGLPFLLKKLS